MAQKRFWNFEADDATIDISNIQLGVGAPGVYRGFDGTLDATMILKLTHGVTGSDETELDNTTVKKWSCVVSRQGVIIKEDSTIELPISNGDGSFDRIDLVIMEHEFIETGGGVSAIYDVIEGTPSATPVAPAIPDPAKQVAIGQLYVPTGTTALNQTGVEWTRERVPGNGNTPTAYLGERNKFTKVNSNFIGSSATFDAGDEVVYLNTESNWYSVTNTGGNDVLDLVFTKTPLKPYPIDVNFTTSIYINFTQSGTLVSQGNGGAFITPNNANIAFQADDFFEVRFLNILGTVLPYVTDHLKYTQRQVDDKMSLTQDNTASGLNVFTKTVGFDHIGDLDIFASPNGSHRSIDLGNNGQSARVLDTGAVGRLGAIRLNTTATMVPITLEVGAPITLKHNTTINPADSALGYFPIFNHHGFDVQLRIGDIVELKFYGTHFHLTNLQRLEDSHLPFHLQELASIATRTGLPANTITTLVTLPTSTLSADNVECSVSFGIDVIDNVGDMSIWLYGGVGGTTLLKEFRHGLRHVTSAGEVERVHVSWRVGTYTAGDTLRWRATLPVGSNGGFQNVHASALSFNGRLPTP